MNKYKYLFKNIGVLTIASFSTKMLSFFLLPLYTSILSTSEYGTYDLINTTISLLVPILTLNLFESVFRFSLDNSYSRKGLLVTSLKYFLTGLFLLSIFVIANSQFRWIEFMYMYPFIFVLLFVANALVNIVSAYARGLDKVADVAISGIVGTLATILLNLLLLLVFKWGLSGYLWATVIGALIQSLYLVVRTKMWREIGLQYSDKTLEKVMFSYSIPLIANSIAWWINSASDRYVVTFFCGVEENGIYSVAYKIPSLLTIFQTVFNQAWTMSAVKEFNQDDKSGFFSTVYNTYNILMVVCCSGLILLNKIISYFLFKNDFYIAWRFAPFLVISVVFGAVSGYIGGIFSTTKKTNITAVTVGIGAMTNIILNIILVNAIGTLGAAIATVISYILVWLIRLLAVRKMIQLNISLKKDVLSYSLLLCQAILYIVINNNVVLYLLETMLCLAIIFTYKKTLLEYYNKIRKIAENRKGDNE